LNRYQIYGLTPNLSNRRDEKTGDEENLKLATHGPRLHSTRTGRPDNFLFYPLARAIGLSSSELAKERRKMWWSSAWQLRGRGMRPSEPSKFKRAAPVGGQREREVQRMSLRKMWRVAHDSRCLDCPTPASRNRRGKRRLHRGYGRVNEAEAATARYDGAGICGVSTPHGWFGPTRSTATPELSRPEPAPAVYARTR
jgi:hypothetical protein